MFHKQQYQHQVSDQNQSVIIQEVGKKYRQGTRGHSVYTRTKGGRGRGRGVQTGRVTAPLLHCAHLPGLSTTKDHLDDT